MAASPLPLKSAPRSELRSIRAVFFDIDDTFSSEIRKRGARLSRILPEAYEALWRLHGAGIAAVPVTGRPAGWCDLIARMWPVEAVVGENGAFYAYLEPGRPASEPRRKPPENVAPARLVKRYLETERTRKRNRACLERLRREIVRAFPRAGTPSDQPFREFDLAIDVREDVPRWKDAEVERLLRFARERGAQAKLSSIHVNLWFGRYDKWSCVARVARERLGLDPARALGRIAYVGDSPNDEPFFARLPFTVGVANVARFLGRMESGPKYIARAEGGLGFAELVDALLKARQ